MTEQVRIAIVGTGNIANAHLAGLAEQGDRVRVVAAMDVDQARVDAFCAKHGIPRAYTDADRLLADEEPALVHVCTPPGTHADLSIRALDAGAWVLCEKPLCASLAELDALDAAEERTGRYVSSVFQWRFGSGARHLKALLDAGELGRPLVGLCSTTWYRGLDYYAVPWRGKWATELGGPTMGHGIHAMDLFLWLLGDWTEVRALLGTLDRAIEVEDVSMALVRFANGALGSIVNSVLSPRQETALRLDCQRATVELTHLYKYTNADWRYTAPAGAADDGALARWRAIPDETPSSHGAQIAALLDSRTRGERPLASGAEARRTIEFITCLYKAAFTGEPVRRGSLGPDDPFYHSLHGATGED